MIAPQHGSIIKKEFIKPLIEKLIDIDCGLYLMDDYYDDVYLLTKVDDVLNKIFKEALITNSFENLIKTLYSYIKEMTPNVSSLIVTHKEYVFMIEDFEIKKCTKADFSNCKFSFNVDLTDESKEKIGTLIVCYEEKLKDKDIAFLDLLFKKLSNIVGVALKKEVLFLELKSKEKELYEKSITDPLTQLYNRGFFNEMLQKKLLESKRYKFPLSLALIDIDFFKKINDNYGHLTGDCVLKELALLLKKHFRGSDIIARYGGEEFAVIMPFTDLESACKKMDEFRKVVENFRFCDSELKVTISVGVKEYNKKDSLEEFIKKADDNLYEAKRSGRNKVVCN
jgi:diguanylate cyclase (GGDEF)-like protein